MNPPLALVKTRSQTVPGFVGEEAVRREWRPMSPLQPLGTVAIQALEQAINRARQAEPAEDLAARLSPDVGRLAGLYGWMIFRGLPEVSPDLLNADELDAVVRWI